MNPYKLTINSVKLLGIIAFHSSLVSCVNPLIASYGYQRPIAQPQYAQQAPHNYIPVDKQQTPVTIQSNSHSTLDLDYKKIRIEPYTFRGVNYTPMTPQQALQYRQTGIASYYKGAHVNSIEEKVPVGMITAAHTTLPLPCVVKVTNPKNGRIIYARVNDRGPFHPHRIIDLSLKGAEMLGFVNQGLCNVTIEVMAVGDGALKVTH